jgi:hypothetical protein
VNLELGVDAPQVVINGVIAQVESVGDFLLDEPRNHQFEHLPLAGRQAILVFAGNCS